MLFQYKSTPDIRPPLYIVENSSPKGGHIRGVPLYTIFSGNLSNGGRPGLLYTFSGNNIVV